MGTVCLDLATQVCVRAKTVRLRLLDYISLFVVAFLQWIEEYFFFHRHLGDLIA